MECCKLRSVGLYNGKVCLAEWGDKEGEPSSFQVLAECTELVYVRLRTLEAVASFRFLERALAVMAHYDMPVLPWLLRPEVFCGDGSGCFCFAERL